jgi:hypothetical protein
MGLKSRYDPSIGLEGEDEYPLGSIMKLMNIEFMG